MKSIIKLTTLASIILMGSSSLAFSWQAQYPDVMGREHLNILTINVLFSEVTDREIRLEGIASFIANSDVDVVLLQEVVGGPLSGTINSALDLRNLLAERGLEYNLRYRLANGLPGILTVGNAILSRHEILWTISKTLPFVTEEPFEGFEIPLRRKVMMSRVKIPGFGKINVYNTHLCAFCDPIEERLEQAEVLMEFIRGVENAIWWDKNPIILGGDFNTNLNNPDNPDDISLHDLITSKGFIDTCATANACTSCCSEDEEGDGCTFAVPGNPYAFNPFTEEQEEPQRIDYIFVKGLAALESVVVFRSGTENDPWVSDHSGVLTRIKLLP